MSHPVVVSTGVGVVIDDVSRMNATLVNRIVYAYNTADLVEIVRHAAFTGATIAPRGQAHSMGAHSIPSGARTILIDMRFMNRILTITPSSRIAQVQAGATWADVLRALDPHGLSPSVMQSYCTFSVGGTLSINAHGITSDAPMASSIISMRVVTPRGDLVECSRTVLPDLFRHVIGGYGMFGIIADVTLRVVNNVKLRLETKELMLPEFVAAYHAAQADPTVNVRTARINMASPETIDLYLFHNTGEGAGPVVSHLDDAPHEMAPWMRVLYKWALPYTAVQRLRHTIESFFQAPLDFTDFVDRNSLMYESAAPIAELYNPVVHLDRTHILQEFFVPDVGPTCEAWLLGLSTAIRTGWRYVQLLNCTIRYVRADKESALPYAPRNSWAFVLYWRLPRSTDAESELAAAHSQLSDAALRLGGTFYLPYRHHYTTEQLLAAYPGLPRFIADKEAWDPRNVFSNVWFEHIRQVVRRVGH